MTTYQHASVQRRRVSPWVAGASGLVLLVLAGLFAYDGWRLVGAADDLKSHAAAAQAAVSARDADALTDEVVEVQAAADTFASATSGPHWWLASQIPWVKSQAVPLMQAGDSVEAMAEGALEPLAAMDDLSALEAPAVVDGRIDPYVLEPYRETLALAASTLTEESDALAEVNLDGTLGFIREQYLTLESQLDELAGLVQGAHVAAEVLPGMLGGDGPRQYIVVVQNNAEPRTTGGIPGAFIEVVVDDGVMRMGAYSNAASMVNHEGVVELTDEEVNVFTRRLAIYPQDANLTPEFPRTGEIISAFWQDSYGEAPDAVVSVDPVALGYMLEGSDAVEIQGFEITADNLADVMLNEAYLRIEDPADQDAFFAQAAAVLFGQILGGGASPVAGVERAIEDGRFLVWSADAAEQELIATTPVGGAFLEHGERLGVFINDGSGSKIGYYIDEDVTVTNLVCSDGSVSGQTIELTLVHTFTGDPRSLPPYISGDDVFVPAGQFHANVMIYPADGFNVSHLTQDGERGPLAAAEQGRRTAVEAWVELEPGDSTALVFTVNTNGRYVLPPEVVATPGSSSEVYKSVIDQPVDGC